MATDATNTPTTNFLIPKYLTSADAPSGKGFNATMDYIDALLKKGFAILTTTGDTIYASAPNVASRLPIGSTNQVLTVAGGLPTWANSVANILTTTGDLPYASAPNTVSRLGAGSNGNVLTLAGGVPTWATPAAGYPFASRTASIAVGYSNANWTLASAGGGTVIPVNTLSSNTDGYALSGLIPGGIVVPRAGYYRVTANLPFPLVAGGYRELTIEKWSSSGTGAVVAAAQDSLPNTSAAHYMNIGTTVLCAASEILGAIAYQNSGSSMTVGLSTASFPNLIVEFLGS